MLQIIQRRLDTTVTPEQAKSLCAKLQDNYNSLLSGVRLEYLRRLGVNQGEDGSPGFQQQSSMIAGEIFLSAQGTVFFLKVCGKGCLQAGGVSTVPNAPFEEFLHDVMSAAHSVGVGYATWQDCDSQPFNEPEDARIASLEVSEKELEAAQEFLKPTSLDLLTQLNQQDSLPLRKLKFPGGDPTRLLSHLEDLDLVRKDYAVISRETGQQILKVSSRTSLEESKFFSAENVDEVISCTSFCQDLLRNDQWLLILVLNQLREMGLADFGDEILVSQADGSPTQVFLGLNRQRFLLVLSNKRLSIDDSYVVSAQISACNLEEVVLISTQRISNLMKHHLNSTNPNCKFHFIDGLKDLQERLRTVIVEKQRSYLRSILDELSELTPVQVPELILARMAPISEPEPAPSMVVTEKLTLPKFELTDERPAPQPVAAAPAPIAVSSEPPFPMSQEPVLGAWQEPVTEAKASPTAPVQDLPPGLGDFPPGLGDLPPGLGELPPGLSDDEFELKPSFPDFQPEPNFELPPLSFGEVTDAPSRSGSLGGLGLGGRSRELPLE